jgi:hypothetical protein
MMREESFLEMLCLQNIGTMDKVQIIDHSNTAPLSKTFRDEIELLFQEHAFESSQKYKEGKFIIELAHMIKENGWD